MASSPRVVYTTSSPYAVARRFVTDNQLTAARSSLVTRNRDRIGPFQTGFSRPPDYFSYADVVSSNNFQLIAELHFPVVHDAVIFAGLYFGVTQDIFEDAERANTARLAYMIFSNVNDSRRHVMHDNLDVLDYHASMSLARAYKLKSFEERVLCMSNLFGILSAFQHEGFQDAYHTLVLKSLRQGSWFVPSDRPHFDESAFIRKHFLHNSFYENRNFTIVDPVLPEAPSLPNPDESFVPDLSDPTVTISSFLSDSPKFVIRGVTYSLADVHRQQREISESGLSTLSTIPQSARQPRRALRSAKFRGFIHSSVLADSSSPPPPPRKSHSQFKSGPFQDAPRDVVARDLKILAHFTDVWEFGKRFDLSAYSGVCALLDHTQKFLVSVCEWKKPAMVRKRSLMRWCHKKAYRSRLVHCGAMMGSKVCEIVSQLYTARGVHPNFDEFFLNPKQQAGEKDTIVLHAPLIYPITDEAIPIVPPTKVPGSFTIEFLKRARDATYNFYNKAYDVASTVSAVGVFAAKDVAVRAYQSAAVQSIPRAADLVVHEVSQTHAVAAGQHRANRFNPGAVLSGATGAVIALATGNPLLGIATATGLAAFAVPLSSAATSTIAAVARVEDGLSLRKIFETARDKVKATFADYFSAEKLGYYIYTGIIWWGSCTLFIFLIRAILPKYTRDTICQFLCTIMPWIDLSLFYRLFGLTYFVVDSDGSNEVLGRNSRKAHEEDIIHLVRPDDVKLQTKDKPVMNDLLEFLVRSVTPDAKHLKFNYWFEALPKWKNFGVALEWFCGKARTIFAHLYSFITGNPFPITPTEFNVMDICTSFDSFSATATAEGGWASFFNKDPSRKSEAAKFTTHIANLSHSIIGMHPVHPTIREVHSKAMDRIRKMNEAEAALAYSASVRPKPVWIALVGDPSIGKGLASDILTKGIFEMTHKHSPTTRGYTESYDTRQVYNVQQSDPYWDGYKNQRFIYVDDLFQSTDLQVNSVFSNLMMTFMSSKPCGAPVADMNIKGAKWLDSDYLITTANEHFPTNLGVRVETALLERRDLLLKVTRHTCGKMCIDGSCYWHDQPDYEFHVCSQLSKTDKVKPSVVTINGAVRESLTPSEVCRLAVYMHQYNVEFNRNQDLNVPDITFASFSVTGPRIDTTHFPSVKRQGKNTKKKVTMEEDSSSDYDSPLTRIEPIVPETDSKDAKTEIRPSSPHVAIETRANKLYRARDMFEKSPLTPREALVACFGVVKGGLYASLFNNIDEPTMPHIRMWYWEDFLVRIVDTPLFSRVDKFARMLKLFWPLTQEYVHMFDPDDADSAFESFETLMGNDMLLEWSFVESVGKGNESLRHDYRPNWFKESAVLQGVWSAISFDFSPHPTASDNETVNRLRYHEWLESGCKSAEKRPTWVNIDTFRRYCQSYNFSRNMAFLTMALTGAAVIVAVASGLYNAICAGFDVNPEEQSGRFAGAHVPQRINTRAPQRRPLKHVVQQAAFRETDMERITRTNIIQCNFGPSEFYALAIGYNIIVFPSHCAKKIQALSEAGLDDTIAFGLDGLNSLVSCSFSDCTIYEPKGDHEQELMYLSVPCLPFRTKMDKRFTDLQETGRALRRMQVVYSNDPIKPMVEVEHIYSDSYAYLDEPVKGCSLMIRHMPNANGFCGLPYYHVGTQQGDVIVAMHGAGDENLNISYAIPLRRSSVEWVLKTHLASNPKLPKDVTTRDVPLVSPSIPANPGTQPIGHTVMNVKLQDKTSLTMTDLHPHYHTLPVDEQGPITMDWPNPTRRPAELRPHRLPDGKMVHPLSFVNEKNHKIKGEVKISGPIFAEELEQIPFRKFAPESFSPQKASRILSFRDVILGAPGVDSLDLTKSSGFPYCAQGKSRSDVLFRDGELNPDYLAHLDDLWNELEHNVVPQIVVDNLKDEPLPNEDVDIGKCRRICIAELDYIILWRAIGGSFWQEMHIEPWATPNSVGLNVHSPTDWTLLFKRLTKHGYNVTAGDCNGFEFTTDPQFVEPFCELHDYLAPLPTRFAAIRRNLIRSMINVYHIQMSRLFFTAKGNSSGNPITVDYNGFVNYAVHFIAWLRLGLTAQQFIDFCEIAVYGDDSVVNPGPFTQYNMVYLAEFHKDIGMHYTASTKAAVSQPFESIYEIDYLKRRFAPLDKTDLDHTIVRAPLKWASIMETTMWVNMRSDNKLADIANMWRAVLLELRHYGYETYEKYYWLATRYCRHHNTRDIFDTYAMAMTKLDQGTIASDD